MEVIKKGSKGDAVKKLLTALGITADGIFGEGTESKVKEFQKSHGLTADGIVGSATWTALEITDGSSIDPSIIYNPLKENTTKIPNRTIKYIAIHYTAGVSSKAGKATQTRNAWVGKKASADFIVDDETIVQTNPDLKNYYCWAVGDKYNKWSGGGLLYGKATNKNTISIEVCSNLKKGTSSALPNHEGWTYTESTLNNTIRLVKILMKKYNIPIENVVRHYDITGKLCPGIIGWNNGQLYNTNGSISKQINNSLKWEEFKNKLK